MKRFTSSLLLLILCSLSLVAADDAAVQIDAFASKLRSDWKIPGFSLTVIKDGCEVLSKGYGVKTLGGQQPVDCNTVYQIGSVSKSFTAALMAMMVDEGLVNWSDRVKDILPDFDLKDNDVEEEVRIFDIMSHRMGFWSQALTYAPNVGYDADDVYRMFALLDMEYPFRDGMHYNNMSFIIAQKIIEKVSGMSWEENLRKRIFEPLGMETASCGEEGFLGAQNVASPHNAFRYKGDVGCSLYKGEWRALHWLSVVGPAGGICCSSADLARWAEFHRSGRDAGGNQLISGQQMDYLHRGVAISSQNNEKITLYGHCWYIEQNGRCRVYYHTGTTWGHAALCVWVPELNLSFAMLFNSEISSSARFALMNRIIDVYLGAPYRDYSLEAKKAWLNGGGGSSNKSGFTIKYSKTVPQSRNLCGHYCKEEPFSDADILLEKGKLYIKIGKYGWKHALGHKGGNTYYFYSQGHNFPVRFKMGKNGKADAFELDWGCGERLGAWRRN